MIPEKVYAAYKAAVEHRGSPTVILAETVKGYGLGEAGEGRNITHQQKKLNEDELREFRTRFGIPISDEDVAEAPFHRPPEESREIQYLRERREKLGGYLPARTVHCPPLPAPARELFSHFFAGSDGKEASTTTAFVDMLEAAAQGQGTWASTSCPSSPTRRGPSAWTRSSSRTASTPTSASSTSPVDAKTLKAYREAKNGQILEEGITEAGSMSSFIAAGTAYATHGIPMIPFFIFYSMFGFQRIGDLIWAAADMRTRGFLLGGTAGRTTLNGEGLQHQDGHSHVLASTVPNLARLRSRLRLRAGRHHPRRHPPDVRD